MVTALQGGLGAYIPFINDIPPVTLNWYAIKKKKNSGLSMPMKINDRSTCTLSSGFIP